MQQRLATFDFPQDNDDQALERAWNSFSEALRARGLRPSDEPIRATDTSVTFRVFVVEHELMTHRLNFDMAKIIAAGTMAAALVAAETLTGASMSLLSSLAGVWPA